MKKLLTIITVISIPLLNAGAEGIRLKNGTIVTGSILEQTEYTLNLQTKYGVITLPQRNIVEILPDKHRVLLKGGGEIIGTITDIDQFNVRLKTDSSFVNVDMPRVASIEIYDYDQAEKEKQFIESQQAQAIAQETHKEVETKTTGITFDDDLDRAFSGKAAPIPTDYTVIRTAPVAATAASAVSVPAKTAAQEVYKAPVLKQDLQTPRAQVAAAQAEKKGPPLTAKPIVPPVNEKKYMAIEIGVLDNSLKLGTGEEAQDIGGVGVGANFKYLWRLGKSNFWLGPNITVSTIPKNTLQLAATNEEALTNGYLFHFNLLANYYITPKSKYQTYLTTSLGYETISVSMKLKDLSAPDDPQKQENLSSSGMVLGVGAGVERQFGDTALGFEAKIYNSQRGEELKDSPSTFFGAMLKFSWKF